MLHSIELENFKAFRHLDNMPITPITVLCGTNSCGKTTILQSILLAKQTVESRQRGQSLQLNGGLVRLGTFQNLVFEKDPNNNVALGFSFRFLRETGGLKGEYSSLRFLVEQLFPERVVKTPSAEYIVRYRFLFSRAKRKSPKTHLRPIIISGVKFSSEAKLPIGDMIEGASISLDLNVRSLYTLTWKNIRSRRTDNSGTASVRVRFNNTLPVSLRVVGKPQKESRIPGLNWTSVAYIDFLEAMFSKYSYIGPLREEPARRYIYESEVLEIGIKGENAAYISLTESDKRIKSCYFYDKTTDSFEESVESIKLIDALTKWLDSMGIKGFKPKPLMEVVSLDLESSSSSKHTMVSIADVGFGVSQILPIILEGLRMPVGNTLLLEQPEIHLHPNLQMQLADYLVSLALAKKGVIVETHSDHIINRLVRRIVQDETYNLNDLISIYFISPSPKGSTYERISIDSSRGIVNWPKDFFDQTATEQEKTLKAGLNKRMSKKL